MSLVCVDASLVVALLIPERFTRLAWEAWQRWVQDECQIVAPMLIHYEVTSAIYRKAFQGLISSEDALKAVEQYLALNIRKTDPEELPLRAFDLAGMLKRPNTYNAHYLALAEILDCPLWTADERFFNSAHMFSAHIYWLRDYLSGR